MGLGGVSCTLTSLCFSHQKAVSMAKVMTQMKKLKEKRVERPVSAAELQKKKALLEQVSLVPIISQISY